MFWLGAATGGVVVELFQEIAGGLGNTHDRAPVVGQEDIIGWEGGSGGTGTASQVRCRGNPVEGIPGVGEAAIPGDIAAVVGVNLNPLAPRTA